MSNSKKIYSQHHFMFPFRWDILNQGFGPEDIKENIAFDKRTDLIDGIPDKFGQWKRTKYTLEDAKGAISPEAYNEFTYFHEFVTRAIFDFDYPFKKNQAIVKYFEFQLDKNLENQYLIEYLEDNQTHELALDLDGITLHLFNTGVGVLSYNVSNNKYADKETILKINEFGRRIYPQFLGNQGIIDTKNNFLAHKISLITNSQLLAVEDFSWYDLHQNRPNAVEPYRLPSFITELFTEQFVFRIPSPLSKESVLISKVGDDRMFFQSWYAEKNIAKQISSTYDKIEDEIKLDWLFCYVFGDKKSPSIANTKMKWKLLNEHTYKRWIEYGTVYGMTRDSFVCIEDGVGLGNLIQTHMQKIYYTISILCLAQRASVLKFTAEVANLADLAKMEQDKKFITNIKDLYKNYIEFINKLYFREITPQIQGIEIYAQFQKVLNHKDEIRDLDNEINELHSYVSLIQDSQRNEEASQLNKWASIFLPATIVFGILGANIFGENFSESFFKVSTCGWIIAGFIPSLLFYIYYKIKRK
jgi:hypothetical protein